MYRIRLLFIALGSYACYAAAAIAAAITLSIAQLQPTDTPYVHVQFVHVHIVVDVCKKNLFACFVSFLLLLLSLTGAYLLDLIRRWFYCDAHILSPLNTEYKHRIIT